MNRLTKPAAALVTALAMLVLLAAPSAADSTGAVTAGTMTLGLAAPVVIPLDGGGTCTPATLTATTAFTNLSIGITQAAFDYLGNPYVFTGTFNGTYSLTGTSGITGALSMTNGRIWTRTGACTPTTTKCFGPIATTITYSGTFSGNTSTMVGDVAFGGSGTTAAFGCTSPFSALNGTPMTLSGVTATLT